jgi:hypothetical protein
MDAGGRMAEKSTDTLGHGRAQNMFQFAGLLFDFLFRHLKKFRKESFSQPVPSNEFSGLLLTAVFENDAVPLYLEEVVSNHQSKNRSGFLILGRLEKFINIRNTFFSQGPDELEEFIDPLSLHSNQWSSSPSAAMGILLHLRLSIHGFGFLFHNFFIKSMMADRSWKEYPQWGQQRRLQFFARRQPEHFTSFSKNCFPQSGHL